MKERKLDAHQKIQLGGLVVKAGLRDMDKNIILGMLIDGMKNMHKQNGAAYEGHYKELGDTGFTIDEISYESFRDNDVSGK